MKFIISTTLMLLSLISFSQEQEVYKLSLEDAIERALDSSYVAVNAKRDQLKALKQKWETTADGLPQISAGIDYEYNPKLIVTPLPGEIVGGEPGTIVPVTFGTEQNMRATATLNQLIFDGSYIVALKAAKTFLEYSKNANDKTRLEVRQSAINAYANALLVESSVEVLKQNEMTVKENLDETQRTFEEGLAEQEEVEQLQITYQQISNSLRNSQRNLDLSKQTLSMVLGIPVDAKLVLTDNLENLAMKQLADFDLIEQQLEVEENIDYKIANNLVKQRQLEWQLEKSKFLPTLTAFANYGTTTFGNEFVFLDSSQQWFQFSTVGVSLNIPIFSSLKRAKRSQRAEIALMQAETDLKESVEQIKLEFNQAKSDYNFALENYQTAQANLDLAERIERKNITKYKEGLSTSFELRQAQLQLYNAQNSYLESMLQLINSKTSLETILNSPNISN
ncbi:TolC family protein [Mesohalobacter halotolerans]|uniref:TolC family protein n=1 Tax=Mesohalobacter halotolerans TaxID=1883405 RepID=A0A4V6AMC8_9FLAO|nr:TolC family protein [Mesohalobacter halotolerans]TKS57055.1 TolC family protein [Mesohalobacter halotolerans]